MDAIKLLIEDHDRTRDLLRRMLASTAEELDKRHQLLELLRQEVAIHTRIEEDVFYPAIDRRGEHEHEQVEDSRGEHEVIRKMLRELESVDLSDPGWTDKVKELHECIEHHVGEEEKDLFPSARDYLGGQLEELGDRMYQEKGDILRGL